MPETISEIPVKLLSSMISRTAFAISMEESRFTLNGALLLLGGDGMTMVATDGHRLAYVQSPMDANGASSKGFRALIPKKAMGEIVKLAEESGPDSKVVFAGDENHLFFRFGERLLITRKLTGNFPDYERVLPKDNTNIVKLRKDLGLTQRQLADMIGAHQPTVARWETGKNEPRGANLKALKELEAVPVSKSTREHFKKIGRLQRADALSS